MPGSTVYGVRGRMTASRYTLLRYTLRYSALGTGCVPLLQCLDQLSLASLRCRLIEYQLLVTIRSPFCGHNTTSRAELNGEDL